MADMTIVVSVQGTVGGRLFNYTHTSTVENVEYASYAQAGHGAGGDIFTPNSFGGVAALVFIGGNTGGLNRIDLEESGGDVLSLFGPSGLPVVLFNGGGFNGMFGYSTTATDGPDQDASRIAGGRLGGIINFRAIGALKAIS